MKSPPLTRRRTTAQAFVVGVAGLLGACAARKGPSSPYACVANTSGVSEPQPSIAEDARALCGVLGAAPRIGALTAEEVRQAVSGEATRVVFYTGHGKRVSAKEGGVALLVERPGRPLSANGLFASLLGEPSRRPLGASDYRIALLNTCDSGYVSLPAVSPAPDAALRIMEVIASGYGRVDRSATGDSPNTAFGAALSVALAGEADRAPLGNCDAIVTDEEAAGFVASRLRQRARGDWDEWEVRPTVVLKRTVDFALPLASVPRGSRCSPPRWDDVYASVPTPLHDALVAHLNFLRGAGPPPPAPHRFLVLVKSELRPEEFARAKFVARLTRLAERLGYGVVDAPEQTVEDIDERLEVASFLNAVVVKFARSPFGKFYVELASPRDRTTLWGAEAPLPVTETAPDLAERLARRLHGRIELFEIEVGGSKRLILRVQGEVPRHITATRWEEFALGTSRDQHSIALVDSRGDFQPAISPCPGGVGQCFQLEDPDLAADPQGWVILPVAT